MTSENDWLQREKILLTEEGVRALQKSHVVIFGLGGVGSYAVTAIARSGVGTITIVDSDVVTDTNRNRQLIANAYTIGAKKTDVMKEEILKINPDCEVHTIFERFSEESTIDFSAFDYVIDCIDDVEAKLTLMARCEALNVPLIASMGTANRIDPTKFIVTTLQKTSNDPLAKRIRSEAKRRNLKDIPVVFSTEMPMENLAHELGSVSFVPPVAGMILGGEVIKALVKK